MRPHLIICLFIAGFCRAGIAQPATAPALSEIEGDFNAQRYQDVVRKSVTALQPRQRMVGADRLAILEFKAESHLRLKQFLPAADAFSSAAKEVPADSIAAAKYLATVRLLKSVTQAGQYQPKPPALASPSDKPVRPTPMNIIEPSDREQALAAFYKDEKSAVEAVIERLAQQKTMPQVRDTLAKIDALRILELSATGSDTDSKLLMDPLKAHVAELLNTPLQVLKEKVTYLTRLANKDRTFAVTVDQDGVRQDVSQKMGLGAAERDQAMIIERDLGTILSTSEELGNKLDVSLEPPAGSRRGRGETGPTLQTVHTEAVEQLALARKLLGSNFVSTPVNPIRARSNRPVQGDN